MLSGVFHTKEKIFLAAMLGLIFVTGVFLFVSYSENKKYTEQTVMAENYLKAGNYEQAIGAYTKAMSMKNVNEQLLSIGLADAYVGLKDYDKALEVLRNCYQKKPGNKIKEKIEAVISEKTEYEYQQVISGAEVYFANKEYDKAIDEYEKAKSIKSKEVTSYKRITQAYIDKKEFEKAREEALEGLELTKDESFRVVLTDVETYIVKQQYDKLINQASDYIAQENYEEGIANYEKAIALLPKESTAYHGLAKAYITQKEYTKATLLLQSVAKSIKDDELKDLLNKAVKLKKAEEEKNNILKELYNALAARDYAKTAEFLNLAVDNKKMAKEFPIYYGAGYDNSSKNQTLIIYRGDKVYLGDYINEEKDGFGILYRLTQGNKKQDYYCYDGEWSHNVPDGEGTTVEVNVLKDTDGQSYVSKTITEGSYYYAYENGRMIKYFYKNGEETGRVKYTAQNGVPVPFEENPNTGFPSIELKNYAIGAIYLGDQPTGKNYTVEPKTMWGVKYYIDKQ